MDGVENPCSSVRDIVSCLSLGVTERLIPAHLTILYEKEWYSSHLSSGWHEFSQVANNIKYETCDILLYSVSLRNKKMGIVLVDTLKKPEIW